METQGRFQSDLRIAHERVTKLQQEAASQRLLRGEGYTPHWRKCLAAQLHGLADRIGPVARTQGELA